MSQGILTTATAGVPLELEYRLLPVPDDGPDTVELPETVATSAHTLEVSWSSEFALLVSMI